MKRENIQDIFGLDSAQTAQLVHTLTPDRDDPGLIQVQFRAKGPLDDAVMQAAWNDVIARHEALRLTVQMPKGKKPMLVMGKAATLDIIHQDLSDKDADAQEQALAVLLADDRRQKLTLSKCPAMRITCVTLSPEEHHYIWTCHHIFLDGWSAAVILRDVLSCYEARLRSCAPDLPGVPGLRDYLARLKAAASQESDVFWRDYLDRCPTEPHVARLMRAAPDGATAPVTGMLPLPGDLAGGLAQAASRMKSTPATLIGLAWTLLLAACSNRQDVVFCKTVSGRNVDLDGIERMAGSFARAVPVRCAFAPDDTVAMVLDAHQRRHFAAQPHEYLPLDEIVEATGNTASLAAFDTLLVVQNHPWQERASDGELSMCDFTSDIMSAFPLTLIATPGAELKLEYIADAALDADLVRDFLAQLPEILSRLCTDPADMRVADVLAGVEVPAAAFPDAETTRLGIIDDMLNGRIRKPGTPTELAITRIWQDVLGVTDIDLEKDFVSLGGRSFAAMRILTRIETRFGKRIPLVDFVKSPTIPALAGMIDGDLDMSQQKWKTLVPIQPNGSKPPLVFLHVAGSHVVFLQPLARRLGADQPIYAFQPVGLEGEAPPKKSFEELAATYVDELVQVQPTGPYYIVGHCAGGRLALEVARLLRSMGHEIATMVVIDTRAPKLLPQAAQVNFKRWLRRGRVDLIATRGFRKFVGRPLAKSWKRRIGDMDERKRVEIDTVERACIAADKRYKGHKHSGRILVLRSEERSWKPFHWDGFADHVETIILPMRHEEMFFEPDVGILADALAKHLSRISDPPEVPLADMRLGASSSGKRAG